MDIIKSENDKKIEWYDALTELLNMGFDLKRNSAEDLLFATNELLQLKKKDKLS